MDTDRRRVTSMDCAAERAARKFRSRAGSRRARPGGLSAVTCGVAVWLAAGGATAALAEGGRELLDAARRGDGAVVQALLDAGADANVRQADGAAALHWAVHRDDAAMTRGLLRAGADVDAANEYGVTPLSLAAANASARMVELLLAAGADPNVARDGGETPLMRAAATGSAAAVEALLASGAEVDAADPAGGQTPLMLAASGRHPGVVAALLARGADVEARSRLGFTPLLFAAREGDLASARRLVAAGADVDAAMPDGTSALLVATVRGQVGVAQFLLEAGADPNAGPIAPRRRAAAAPDASATTDDGTRGPDYTALHWAVGAWQTELAGPNGIAVERDPEWEAIRGVPGGGKPVLVEALLAFGADPNARMRRIPRRFGYSQISYEHNKQGVDVYGGATPLMLAAMAGDAELMRRLAASGADPSLKTDDGTTLLMVAAGLGRYEAENLVTESRTLEAVRAALELGADVNAVNDVGNTALHAAAHIKSTDIVQLLADRGAAIDVANERGDTPVLVADRFRAGSGNVTVRTPTGDLLRALAAQEPAAEGR